MKFFSQNTYKISIILIGILFTIILGWMFLRDYFSLFPLRESYRFPLNTNQNYWEMLHATHTNKVSGISCNLVYPIFFSGSNRLDFGEELFKNIWEQQEDNALIENCEGHISRPIFQDIGWGYASGTLTLTFSGGMSSIFEIDQAFDTNGKLIANDHDFQVDISSLTQDLAPYFGKNIIHTLNSKIDQMVNQDRVIAPNNHERVLFFRNTPTVSWPSDWKEIHFIGSKDDWHIVLPQNLARRYKIQDSFMDSKIHTKNLSITFDDGPHKQYTPIILDILKAHNIKATFCILGSQAIKYPALVRRMYEEGHEICNHSVTHSNFASIPLLHAQNEIAQNEKIINDILGMSIVTPFVRPPYGAISPGMEQELNTPFALWSVDTLDWKDQRSKSIMRRASVVQPGDIVLFHDIHPGVIKILDEYISQYSADGYSFVTLSQMIDSGSLSEISGQSLFRQKKVRYIHNDG